jgi:hypothetical protein
MRREKTFLPLVGKQNHGDSHRVVLFSSMTTHSYVHSVSDLRDPENAGPKISGLARQRVGHGGQKEAG